MNRERFAWLLSLAVILVLAISVPGTWGQRDDEYAFVRTLIDIHRQVASNWVEPVDESKLREGAIKGMLDKLDPFTMYVPPAQQEDFDNLLDNSFKGVGIQLSQQDDGSIEVVTPIDGSPAFKAGVQAGDIILKVNGEDLGKDIRLPDVIKKVAGPLGTQVKLTVRHVTGEEVELAMTREEIVVPVVKGYTRAQNGSWDYYVCSDPKIAYVRITQFTTDTADKLRESITPLLADGMKGLILDLRWNPGGRLEEAIKVVDMFVKQGTIVSTKGRNRPEKIFSADGVNTLPSFPMIVLVNEHSASASEIVSGSLLDNHRAVVVGTRTYGKGSVQEVIPLDSKGGELKLTVAYYYLPSGRLVHRKKDATDWGVQPQIVVPMDDDTQRAVIQQRYDAEIFKKPLPKSTTKPTSVPVATAAPTTQQTDSQLQRAVDTMIALTILDENRGGGGLAEQMPAMATTEPSAATSQPATQE